MRPLPVLDIIRDAWRFTVTHLGAIIGLIWAPMVMVTVAGFFMDQRYNADAEAALAANNMAVLGPTLLVIVCYRVASLLLYAMMYAAVAGLALGQRQEGVVVHFAFGPPEWRLFRTLLGFILLLLPLCALWLLSIGQAAMGGTAPGPRLLAAETVALLLSGAILFVAVRFGALLIAIAVAEDKPALARSWTLSAGHFWRLLAVVLGSSGPVVLVTGLVELALQGSLGGLGGNADAILSAPVNLPLATGLEFLTAPFVIGLSVGASVFSWRALTRSNPP